MIVIPNHIWKMTTKLQKALEERTDAGNTQYLKDITHVLEQMKAQEGPLFSEQDEYIGMMNLATEILRIFKQCNLCREMKQDIVGDLEVNPGLEFALNHLAIVNHQMHEEVDLLISHLQEATHERLSNQDMVGGYKIFKLVSSRSAWKRICNKQGMLLQGTGLRRIKVFYSLVQTKQENVTGAVKLARDHLLRKLGEKEFSQFQEAFAFWFKLGNYGVYYVYAPMPGA